MGNENVSSCSPCKVRTTKALTATFLLVVLQLAVYNGYGQQVPQFTQFPELRSFVNPAATGANELLRIGLAGRHQWMGLEDMAGQAIGPQSYLGYADIPMVGISSGLGVQAMFDRNGYEETVFLRFNGAHHLQLGEYSTISLGLAADYISKSFDFDMLPAGSSATPVFTGLERASGFDLGAGIYYRHDNGLFAGLSAHNILQTSLAFSGFNYGYDRQFHFTAGTILTLVGRRNVRLDLLPALLVHTTASLTPQYTAQATLLLNERYFAGAAYRYQDAIGAIAGVVISNFRIGLSYDYTTNELRQAGSTGSPEVTISWSKPAVKKTRWPGRCYW